MSDVVLSEKATAVLRKLRKRYKTEFGSLKVRNLDLKILQVADLEHLLAGKDPFADVSSFPFWVRLWEAAMVLADIVVSQAPASPGRLLELGAGLGAPGLAAAKAGYQVTLSDYEPHILDFQRVSASANGLDQTEFRIIDWNKPPKMAPFDTIIGAEILFRKDFFQPLLKIFRTYLAPGGVIYLAHDANRQSLKPFLEMASADFNIAAISRKLTSEDKELTIVLNRLQHRATN
ncbi:MAG: methyltransferase domain-containing protein [Proteobacteria bacterium]|nr:methyltransferase domain-containing protein [Pseudomonadota bacterium]MBU1687921.1 methyltransferase domain-containing protein [Pseudomonadota bacterium]